jgi:uncharacterized Tic20 family protein
MDIFLPILLGIVVLSFFARVIYLLIKMAKLFREMRKKYPVSIWKLPSTNRALMDDQDRKATTKFQVEYILTLIIGMIMIIVLATLGNKVIENTF